MKQFLINTRTELKHVVWPTRARAITYALIIIVFSLVLGYVLFGFDALFRELLKLIFVK
jgi:preprotein translocase SecE subunit